MHSREKFIFTLKDPKVVAITSFILAMPFLTIFALCVLGIEPDFGSLEPLLNKPDDQPDILGSAIVLGAFLE